MDKGQYVCYLLNYNTGTCWNCDDNTITQYPGYPMKEYGDLSIDKKQKREKVCMDGSDRIVSKLYIKKYIPESNTCSFITGKSVSKDIEHIKERVSDFGSFKEEVGMNKIICNKIQTSISLWNEDLETVIENNEFLCSSETNSYYWLSFDRLKKLSR